MARRSRGDLRTIYAPHVVVRSPGGELRGLDDVVARVAPDPDAEERTQHFHTDLSVELAGDRAVAETNQLVQFFISGRPPHRTSRLATRYVLARTEHGWCMSEVDITVQWLVGDMLR